MKESYRQKPFLTLAAGVAAMALLLAGCGGGSSSTTPTTPTTPTEPPAPTGPSAEDLFVEAQNARAAADAAVEAAGQAVKDAVKYSTVAMLKSQGVMGESMKAQMNAQMVLDAQSAGDAAVKSAEDAQMAAEDALEDAQDLEDSATKTSLIAALEAAVEHAKMQVMAAKAARDVNPVDDGTTNPTAAVDSLKEAVQQVTGTDMENPMDASDIGKAVATAVQTALDATLGTGTTVPATGATIMHNGMEISAMTWAEIVGEANVMDVRRLSGGSVSPVKAMSVMGSMASDLDTSGSPPASGSDSTTNTDGTSFAAAYMGIPGQVFCAGADCAVDTDGNLTGSWYFSPGGDAALNMLYVADPDMDNSYKAAALFARYGYWLVDSDSDGVVDEVNPYAAVGNPATDGTGTNTANLNTGVAAGSSDTTATYRGGAVGISAHTSYDGNNNPSGMQSGQFTAAVTLTAKFDDTTPMLGGTISNFQGNGVDPRWMVKLADTQLTNAALTGGAATGDAGETAGAWSATGYGPAQTPAADGNPAVDHRPTGFFGTFNANFTDGAAAGAYAVRDVKE